MLNLYKVEFAYARFVRPIQAVIVSASNKRAAIKRVRLFIATHYTDKLTFDDCRKICRTPDDVLDWS